MDHKKYHDAYREFRALGKGKIESLKLSQAKYPVLYRTFCEAQGRGEAWTREPLDEKDEARRLQIIATGRLI